MNILDDSLSCMQEVIIMKKWVKNTKQELNIDVYFMYDFENEDIAASSKIKPIYIDENTIDPLALIEYQEFREDCLNELLFAGFELLESSKSESSVTSRYYTLADSKQTEQGYRSYLIFLRISDHSPQLTQEQEDWLRQKRDFQAEQYKLPKDKVRQKWKPRYITVNAETFYSYQDALEYVIKLAEQWKNQIK